MRLATRTRTAPLRPFRLRFAKAAGAPLAPVTFPSSPLGISVEIALGADPAGDPATWSWLDIAAPDETGQRRVRYEPGIQIVYGRRDEKTTVDASTARLVLDNRGGRFVRRNPLGPYYGLLSKNTPIRIGVNPGDGRHYRYHGFVTEWPTRWTDESGNDSTVPIVCAGILRRLTHNQRLGSALTRAMAGISAGDFQPVAHWPLEDGSYARLLGAAVPGTLPASVSAGNVSLASYSGAAGSDPVPVLNAGGQISGVFPPVTLTPRANGDTIWQVQFMAVIPSGMSANSTFLELVVPATGGDNITKLKVQWINASTILTLRWYDASGTQIGVGAALDFATWGAYLLDTPVLYGISIYFDHNSPGFVAAQFAAFLPGTTGPISFGVSSWSAPSMPTPRTWRATTQAANAGWSFSHHALYTDPNLFTVANQQDNADAINGFTGEMAHDRMARLCRESGISFYCTSAVSAAMGPQSSASLLDNLRDCETADMGVLYEHEFGLGYQSLDDRVNAPVQFALDFDRFHIAGTPEPADDDQRTVNLAVASRPSGSSATAQDDDSIAADGLYEASVSANVQADAQLSDVAQRQVFTGTIDEDRWPSIPIQLTGSPDLIPAWTALPFGARMTVANPPSQVASDTIDAVIEGWSETIYPDNWEVALNTSPAAAYKVGRIAAESGDTAEDVGNLESDSCALAADVTSGAASWSVNTTPLATTAADDMGFLIRFGGEVVRVNSITGVANPQTWDVTRAVNGVVRAQTSGTPGLLVRPFMATT